jgi:hypothetical protein
MVNVMKKRICKSLLLISSAVWATTFDFAVFADVFGMGVNWSLPAETQTDYCQGYDSSTQMFQKSINYTPVFQWRSGSANWNCCVPSSSNGGAATCNFTLHYDGGGSSNSTTDALPSNGGAGQTGTVTTPNSDSAQLDFPSDTSKEADYTITMNGWCRTVVLNRNGSQTTGPVISYSPSVTIRLHGYNNC